MDITIDTNQLEREMLQHGRNLVARLFVLVKTAHNYGEGHSALAQPVDQLHAVISSIHRMNAEASLSIKGEYLFLGDFRIKPEASGFEAFRFIMEEMKQCGLGTVNFTPEVQPAEIAGFVRSLLRVERSNPEQTFGGLQQLMASTGVVRVELEMMNAVAVYAAGEEVRLDSNSRARRIYFQALKVVDEIMGCAAGGKSLRFAKAKRVVQGMIDQALHDPTDLLALTSIKCRDKYTGNHPVNVCILAILVGLRAGFSKYSCCELGLTALCHDLGKALLPQELLNKENELTREEWAEMQQHPLHGVKLVMELKQFDVLTAKMLAGMFEHHLNFNYSGYPRTPHRRQGVFARIINVVDDFDALTSSRVYLRDAKAPERVVRYMLSKSGTMYDPAILKLFVAIVGQYPVGTMVLLDSKELGVVVSNQSSDGGAPAPSVKIIADSHGKRVDGDVVQVAGTAAGGRAIIGTFDPKMLQVNPAVFIV